MSHHQREVAELSSDERATARAKTEGALAVLMQLINETEEMADEDFSTCLAVRARTIKQYINERQAYLAALRSPTRNTCNGVSA